MFTAKYASIQIINFATKNKKVIDTNTLQEIIINDIMKKSYLEISLYPPLK